MTIEEARAIREAFLEARRAKFATETRETFLAACDVEDAAIAAWRGVPEALAEVIREEDMAQAMREWEASR